MSQRRETTTIHHRTVRATGHHGAAHLEFTSSIHGGTMRPLATAALAATITLSLSACSTDDNPPPSPPPTSHTTTPANPDATLPPMPQAAGEFSASGASTFVGYYIEVLQYAAHTGDTDRLRALSKDSCEGCARYADLFDRVKAGGGWATERDWSKADESELRWGEAPGTESFYTTELSLSRGTIKTSSTTPVQEVAASSSAVTFGLVFDGGWTVSQFGLGEIE